MGKNKVRLTLASGAIVDVISGLFLGQTGKVQVIYGQPIEQQVVKVNLYGMSYPVYICQHDIKVVKNPHNWRAGSKPTYLPLEEAGVLTTSDLYTTQPEQTKAKTGKLDKSTFRPVRRSGPGDRSRCVKDG
jgi:hypothetical protein